MSDAAGQPADRLQPEHLLQPCLDPLPFGDVEQDARHPDRPAAVRVDGGAADHGNRMLAAVRPDHPVLGRQRVPLPQSLFPRRIGRAQVIRVQCIGPDAGTDRCVCGQPEQSLGSRVPPHLAGDEVVVPGAEARGFEGEVQCFPALANLFFGSPDIGQVAQGLGKPDDLALSVPSRAGGDRSPEPVSVLAHQPALTGGAAVLDRRCQLPRRNIRRLIFRGEEVGHRGAEELGHAIAEHAIDPLVPGRVAPLGVKHEDGVVDDLVGRRAVAFFGERLRWVGGSGGCGQESLLLLVAARVRSSGRPPSARAQSQDAEGGNAHPGEQPDDPCQRGPHHEGTGKGELGSIYAKDREPTKARQKK